MCANRCRFRFYGNLNDFLPTAQHSRWIDYAFDGTVAVKHPIESLGVPHPEVEQILADGTPVDFAHHLHSGEDVLVYPMGFATPAPNTPALRPPLNRPARFVLDTHLGRLAAYLRMLGFDAEYRNDYHDVALADISASAERVLLTRDRGLLKRKIVVYGYCIRHAKPRTQLVSVVKRYGLTADARPWRRCVRCNGLLQPVDKADILDRLEPKTRLYYDEFQHCISCGQIYWRGSHHERMRSFLTGVLAEVRLSSQADPT